MQYEVTNGPEYNNALRRRGHTTIWFTEEALAGTYPAKTGARDRPLKYADLAIETALFIRQVFHLPLRQTEGFINSLTSLMKTTISMPDFRSILLPRHVLSRAREPGNLVIVDATGLNSGLNFRYCFCFFPKCFVWVSSNRTVCQGCSGVHAKPG